jgi:hypothetical protein
MGVAERRNELNQFLYVLRIKEDGSIDCEDYQGYCSYLGFEPF